MPGNQFNEYMPQAPGVQQKNIEVYAQSLAHQHRVAMSNTSSPQALNSNVQGSPMPQPGLDGQEHMFADNGSRPGALPANGGGAPQQGNHALQDYQMQLMLLEQQNKKRLLMARQEQDNQSVPHQQGVIGAPGFGAAMSPQGSRAGGPSPNPADQMKRGTPKLNQQPLPNSPMPDGMMPQQRNSPAPNGPGINFDPSLAPPGMPPQFYPQMSQNGMGMRPPSSHPQFNGPQQQLTPQHLEAMRNSGMQNGGMQNGGMQNGGMQNGWRGPPQPGMMPGGQQMGGSMGQNPQQRQQMPPPPAPTNEQPRPEPSPSQSNQAPPTPNQGNKAGPKKKTTKDNKVQFSASPLSLLLSIVDVDCRSPQTRRERMQVPLRQRRMAKSLRLRRPRLLWRQSPQFISNPLTRDRMASRSSLCSRSKVLSSRAWTTGDRRLVTSMVT
jgi:hypothetical protein